MRLKRLAAAAGVVALLLWAGATGRLCRAEIAGIRIYQRVGSPVMSVMTTCRFDPTCSHYAVQALEDDGLIRGNWRIVKRLAACSPAGWLTEDNFHHRGHRVHR